MRWQEREMGETSWLGRLATLVVKLVLGVAGFIFMLSLLVAGLIALLGFVLWSLLRGRRPTLVMPRFSMPPGRQWGFPHATARGTTVHAESAEIVDVEVREIADELPPLDKPR